jgi:hypothetical protein
MRLGRYDNPYKCVSYSAIDPSTRLESVVLEAADGGLGSGLLHTKGNPKTVVCFMHPKADMSRHYAIPALIDAGYAAFGQNSRWINNDELCVHENLLLDVAAGVRFLRGRGFEKILLCGNSGGGSLYAFYIAQASTPPPGRLKETPAGDSVDLNTYELPPVDGYINLAAHLGEGKILMAMIDPSVTDENDPLSTDPHLDPFNPENGYRLAPESSHYAPEFVARYRTAQHARVARLDAIAHAAIERRNEARMSMVLPEFGKRPWKERANIQRHAVVCPYMVIYRTEADLRMFDTSLDPSERDAGSLFSYRPDLTNYMEFGFGRVQTPRAWLSTWSGISSNADAVKNAAQIRVPSMVIYYRGDNAIFPGDARSVFEALAADDKTFASAPGDHYGFGVGTQDRTGAPEALKQVVNWLRERFPV